MQQQLHEQNTQKHCLITTMTLPQFDSEHIQKHTSMHQRCPPPPPIKQHTHTYTHTRPSVRLLEEEPCSPFVHASSSSRMAFFLSSSLYLSFLSAPSALSAIFNGVCAHKEATMPPIISGSHRACSQTCMNVLRACACRMCTPVAEMGHSVKGCAELS